MEKKLIVIFCSTGSWYKANWLLVHSSIVHLPSRFQLHFGDVNKASEREEIDGQNHGNENELRQCSSIRKFESTNEPKPSEPTLPTTTLRTTNQHHHNPHKCPVTAGRSPNLPSLPSLNTTLSANPSNTSSPTPSKQTTLTLTNSPKAPHSPLPNARTPQTLQNKCETFLSPKR